MRLAPCCIGLTPLLIAGAAAATPKTFQHDQFNADLATAATEVQGLTLDAQAAWAASEAFGQKYTPDPGDYPLEIHGIDMILAAPPNAVDLETHADIEIWNSSATGPDPGAGTMIFTVNTIELFNPNTMTFGFPLKGGVTIPIEFDWSSPTDHPPVITSGSIWVIIRFPNAPTSLEVEWGLGGCAQNLPMQCGCQNVGTWHDQAIQPNVNVAQILAAGCSGTASDWYFMETLDITGDLIMRMKTEVPGGPCTPNCGAEVCGDDGCGGSCGTCNTGETCRSGVCEIGGQGCTINRDCLNGTYCGSSGTCTFDCRLDIDCADTQYCGATGTCVALDGGGCDCGASPGIGFGFIGLLLLARRKRR